MALLTAFGVPAGIYIASIVSLMQWVSTNQVNWFVSMCAGILAFSIYTFHRASISVADEATSHLQPRHLVAIQLKMVCLPVSIAAFISSVVGLYTEDAILGLLPLVGFASILFYRKPILKAPLRTIPLLKPLMVGFGIASFGYCLFDFSIPLDVVLAFGLICTADAFLCDVEDISFDKACGCTTLASSLPHSARCLIVLLFYGAASMFLPLVVSVSLLGLSIPFIWQRFVNRTYVDVRPALILLLAWLV